jgi:hypothetical protein
VSNLITALEGAAVNAAAGAAANEGAGAKAGEGADQVAAAAAAGPAASTIALPTPVPDTTENAATDPALAQQVGTPVSRLPTEDKDARLIVHFVQPHRPSK